LTESQFSAKLLRALRQRLPTAVIWKLNDRFTSGIPDAVVVYKGRATWIECKVKNNPLTVIQFETLRRLHRGYLVRWDRNFGFYGHIPLIGRWSSYEGPFNFERLLEGLEMICKTP